MRAIVQDISQALKSIQSTQANTYSGIFYFSDKVPVLKGHFPGQPIVPGVYLLECAAQTFMQGEKKALHVFQVKQAKFMAPVYPPCEIEVQVSGEQTASGWKVDCTIQQGETVAVTALFEMVMKE